jgi:1-acyl-sn-glycerol-3-phosphate acyltransferase
MFTIMALGVKVSYLMKKEAFFWPVKGLFMALGGIPLDRSAAQDTVSQICEWFKNHEKLWVVITPEGTRSKVNKWKTGFLRVAHEAEVPVVLVAWDYPTKSINIEKLWHTTGDHETDAQSIRAFFNKKYTGKYPDKQ